ncbi:heat shock protein HslJ [Shimia isoporae]|uniref:Heat shock protein HslJ n=1 Tax=Shimia isoporae TaxID=647720 RepID=A0A4R1N275_9RHOB|nr:META domain-containing protein [Shimia isoporae]TCL00480.1 heat shock protein HslJ [Shimia isoporae]
MKKLVLFSCLLIITACDPGETLVKYGGGNYVWRLVEVDGQPVTFSNEIAFGPHGSVNGTGPCTQFTAGQRAPYPWFEIELEDNITAPECTFSTQERKYFADLKDMQIVEVSGPNMVLTNEDGREMVFVGITDGG